MLQADLERSSVFMDSSVSESSKAEEIILPEIRFLTPAELDSLRANAEELKKVRARLVDENALIFRTPWNAFPDITVQTTVAKLKAHPDYGAAKSGDQDAALRVIDQLFKPGKLTDSCDFIVSVRATHL